MNVANLMDDIAAGTRNFIYRALAVFCLCIYTGARPRDASAYKKYVRIAAQDKSSTILMLGCIVFTSATVGFDGLLKWVGIDADPSLSFHFSFLKEDASWYLAPRENKPGIATSIAISMGIFLFFDLLSKATSTFVATSQHTRRIAYSLISCSFASAILAIYALPILLISAAPHFFRNYPWMGVIIICLIMCIAYACFLSSSRRCAAFSNRGIAAHKTSIGGKIKVHLTSAAATIFVISVLATFSTAIRSYPLKYSPVRIEEIMTSCSLEKDGIISRSTLRLIGMPGGAKIYPEDIRIAIFQDENEDEYVKIRVNDITPIFIENERPALITLHASLPGNHQEGVVLQHNKCAIALNTREIFHSYPGFRSWERGDEETGHTISHW